MLRAAAVKVNNDDPEIVFASLFVFLTKIGQGGKSTRSMIRCIKKIYYERNTKRI